MWSDIVSIYMTYIHMTCVHQLHVIIETLGMVFPLAFRPAKNTNEFVSQDNSQSFVGEMHKTQHVRAADVAKTAIGQILKH